MKFAAHTSPESGRRPPRPPHPQPDKAAILEALEAMFGPGDVIELRAIFDKGKKCTHVGYFDAAHWNEFVEHAARLNRTGAAVYVTLNPVDPQLLSRYNNRMKERSLNATADHDIVRRRWLLIDIDPRRPKDTSSTSVQLRAAEATANACRAFLRDGGWPEPLLIMSGNGRHLIYPLDLPNDDASRDLIKGVLAGLAARFDDAAVQVDQSVSNAARITKLAGTVALKGDHTAIAPHRLAVIEDAPPRDAVVTEAQLRALCPPQPDRNSTTRGNGAARQGRDPFDMPGFLARHGLDYTQDVHNGGDRYKLARCPFNADHVNGEAAVFVSATGVPGFHCMHSSCTEKSWRDVRDLLDGPRPAWTNGANGAAHDVVTEHDGDGGPIPLATLMGDPPPANGSKGKRRKRAKPPVVEIDASRPVIDCQAGHRAKIVTELAQALAKTALYYRRDSAVVRLLTLPVETTDRDSGIERKAGSVVMRVADAPSIVRDVSAVACTVKYDMRAGAFRAVDLPKDAALSLISVGAEDPAFKPLAGIAYCPIMRSNGEFETAAGYDARSGLFLAGDEDWSALTVSKRPTHDEAEHAAAWLMKEIYAEFNFVGAVDKAVVLSSVLTAVIRPALDTAPVHGFDAPGHGFGKSMLAELAGIIAMGMTPPMLPPGETKEETMKRVDSAVLAGDSIVVLDNVSEALTGDALCVAMTAARVSVRPLGSSIMVTVPSSAFWMVTGANLQISKDMVRRAVIARVDAKTEHPEQRTFTKTDLKAWVRAHRLEILSNVFTILRAHAQHGFPSGKNKPPPLGSFEQWSRCVVNCLLWLGYENPVASQARLYDDDPARTREDAMLSALLDWQEKLHFKVTAQQNGWEVSDVRAALSVASDGPAAVLRDAIDDTCRNGVQGFPYWLRNVRDRIVNGKRLVCEKDAHTKMMRWKVMLTRGPAEDCA